MKFGIRKFIYFSFVLVMMILISKLFHSNLEFNKSINSFGLSKSYQKNFVPDRDLFLNILFYLNQTTELNLWYDGYYNLNNERESELMKHVQFVYDYTCNENTEFLIAIISAGNHFKNRNIIRSTFGRKEKQYEYNFGNNSPNPNISHCFIFITGYNNDKILDAQIDDEFQKYKDVVRIPTRDTYDKLTFKTMLAFQLIDMIDGRFKFISKLDDDIFIRTKYIIPFIYNMDLNISAVGFMRRNDSPVRNKKNKYFISYDTYPENIYPDYFIGAFYTLRRKIISEIISTHYKIPYFPLEDIYLGMIFRILKINLYSCKNLMLCYYDYCFLQKENWIFIMPESNLKLYKLINHHLKD